MKQNQQFRGLGLVLLVIVLITFASSLTSQGSLFSQEMTHREFNVDNRALDAGDATVGRLGRSGLVVSHMRSYSSFLFSASALPMISVSSWVIEACREALSLRVRSSIRLRALSVAVCMAFCRLAVSDAAAVSRHS